MDTPTIDVLILSNTASVKYFSLLKKCVTSIKDSANINTNIIVVESNRKLKTKHLTDHIPIDKIIYPDEEFNYNKFLNIGLKHCNNDSVLITNNDVFYERDTLDMLHSYLDTFDSVSPWDNNITPKLYNKRGIYIGHELRYNVAGYSFLVKKSALEKIGGFDERFAFWYADNDYAMSLKENGLKHALIGYASVFHAVEQSHDLFDKEERIKQTYGAKKIFEEKWKKVKEL